MFEFPEISWSSASSLFLLGRVDCWKMMPSDDSRGVVWTVPRTWEGLAWSGGSASNISLDSGDECGRNASPVAGGECADRYPRWSEPPSRQVAKSPSRQVGKSAEDITLPVQGPARGLGGDYPGGDACFGPRPATSTPHGLTTENSAQIPLVGKTSHWGGVVLGVHSYLRLSD